MKIAVVTCYKYNDYVRARTLRTAIAACRGVDMVVVRNRHQSLLRYPEVALRLVKTRWIDRPDAYLITFRGYEMMLLMRLTLVRKSIIFDEFVNFTEWMEEHNRLRAGSLLYKMFRRWNRWVVKKCRFILADTDAHARNSAILNTLSIDKYREVPVCADEELFNLSYKRTLPKKPFIVLYYGNMLALHGLEYVLRAAELLKDRPEIEFRLIGGKSKVAKACARAMKAGANLTHEHWLPFEELPRAIQEAGLTLGGPFGGTLQANFVVTGKTYQALACAAPVLIGKNQVNEGFNDKVNCLMVPQADAEALAEAIRWAADHPSELARIGRAGRELYEQHFSQAAVNKVAQELVAEL